MGLGMVKYFIQCVIRTILSITLLLGRYELPKQPKSPLGMRQIASPSKTDWYVPRNHRTKFHAFIVKCTMDPVLPA